MPLHPAYRRISRLLFQLLAGIIMAALLTLLLLDALRLGTTAPIVGGITSYHVAGFSFLCTILAGMALAGMLGLIGLLWLGRMAGLRIPMLWHRGLLRPALLGGLAWAVFYLLVEYTHIIGRLID